MRAKNRSSGNYTGLYKMVKYEFASITPWFKNWFNQFAERNNEIKIFITKRD